MPEVSSSNLSVVKHIIMQIAYAIYPFIVFVAGLTGFIMLLIACFRLTKHGKTQQTFRYYAPSTTIFMFVSGVILVSITNFFQVLTASLLPSNSLEPKNTLLRYIQTFPSVSANQQTMYLLFSVLMIVGLVSLIRGMVLLTKVSEGNEGHLGRTLSHILAGIVTMNAEFIIQSVQSGNYSAK